VSEAWQILTIFSPALPSPYGFFHFFRCVIIRSAAVTIRSGSVPARTFAPTSTVSGRSVFSRSVTQGTFRIHASSWRPPESVSTSDACASSSRKSRYPIGCVMVMPSEGRLKSRSIFWVRGCIGKMTGTEYFFESDDRAAMMPASRSCTSTFSARWAVARKYLPGDRSISFRTVERFCAIERFWNTASTTVLPVTWIFLASIPSCSRLSRDNPVGAKRRSEI